VTFDHDAVMGGALSEGDYDDVEWNHETHEEIHEEKQWVVRVARRLLSDSRAWLVRWRGRLSIWLKRDS
jgi:hypothetical protein